MDTELHSSSSSSGLLKSYGLHSDILPTHVISIFKKCTCDFTPSPLAYSIWFKPYLSHFTLVNDFSLGSLAHGKHLIQALPSVFPLQCPTGKADNNKLQTITMSVAQVIGSDNCGVLNLLVPLA